jgi:MtN3 and saliva related transmembrane protein
VITTIGIVAAVLTTSAFLPQAWKTAKTRQTNDFSWPYLLLFACGVSLWTIYGIVKKDVAIIGANGVTLVLVLVIIGVKMRGAARHRDAG